MVVAVGDVVDGLPVCTDMPPECVVSEPGSSTMAVYARMGALDEGCDAEGLAAGEDALNSSSCSAATWYMPKRLLDCVSVRSSRSAASSRSACDSSLPRGTGEAWPRPAESAEARMRMVQVRIVMVKGSIQ
jgi:hypothetical protein